MSFACPSCHRLLRAQDVRLDIALATCHACGAVHDLSARGGLASPSRPKAALRPQVPLPERFQLDTEGATLRIAWRWFEPMYGVVALLSVAGCATVVLALSGMFTSGDKPPAAVFIATLMFAAVGAVALYAMLAHLVNRTHIDASRDLLSVRHGPLPWPGNLMLRGNRFAQLYVEGYIRRVHKTTQEAYCLMAIDRRGEKTKLLDGLENKEHALFLEQEIERHLGIEDVPVRGAVEV